MYSPIFGCPLDMLQVSANRVRQGRVNYPHEGMWAAEHMCVYDVTGVYLPQTTSYLLPRATIKHSKCPSMSQESASVRESSSCNVRRQTAMGTYLTTRQVQIFRHGELP